MQHVFLSKIVAGLDDKHLSADVKYLTQNTTYHNSTIFWSIYNKNLFKRTFDKFYIFQVVAYERKKVNKYLTKRLKMVTQRIWRSISDNVSYRRKSAKMILKNPCSICKVSARRALWCKINFFFCVIQLTGYQHWFFFYYARCCFPIAFCLFLRLMLSSLYNKLLVLMMLLTLLFVWKQISQFSRTKKKLQKTNGQTFLSSFLTNFSWLKLLHLCSRKCYIFAIRNIFMC